MNRVVFEETLRRHVTSAAYLTFLALLALLALGISNFDRPGSVWPSLVTLLAIITGAGVIGPEFSSGTLQLILVKPVNRAVYLLSRVAGVVAAVWVAAIIAALCELAGRAMWGDALAADKIGVALLNAAIDSILTVSLLALLGSLTRAYFNVGIYLGAMFTFSAGAGILGMLRMGRNALGRFLTDHPGIERGFATIERNLFPEAPARLDRDWLLLVLANASVALVLACLAFRRREVPYGAD